MADIRTYKFTQTAQRLQAIMNRVEALAGVESLTCVTTNTTHALTGGSTGFDNAVFKFKADADFNSSDTVTVNGVIVTCLLPTGDTIPDGFVVSGASALCILDGTSLYFVGGGGNTEELKQEILDEVADTYLSQTEASATYLSKSAASTTLPLMDGTASVGTEQTYARGDHVHPTDTTRLSVTDALSTYARILGDRRAGNIPSGTSLADYCRTDNVPTGLSFWGIQQASDNPRPGIVGTALVFKPTTSGQYTVPFVFSSGITYISNQLGATGGFSWHSVTGLTDNLQCTGESNITFTLNQAQKNGNVAVVALDFKSSTAKSAWSATGITVPSNMRPNASRNIYVATSIGGNLLFTQWQVLDTGVVRLSRSMGANVQHTVTLIYLI